VLAAVALDSAGAVLARRAPSYYDAMVGFTQGSSRSWLAVAVSAAVLSAAPEAAAKCSEPQPILAPSSGRVPLRPVLELLLPDWAPPPTPLPHVVAKGANGTTPAVVVKADTAIGVMRTFRVEIGKAQPGPLQVELQDDEGATVRSWSFVVDARWKAPARSLAKITVRHVHQRWTCSHTSTTNLTFVGAASAYRVVAASSVADLAAGHTRSFVLPRAMSLFWEPEASVPPVDVELGYADCFGETFDWTKGAVVAQVLALQPDGTEQPVTATPIRIGPP
jgi:hypothetical protein